MRILIVDDHPDYAESLRLLLEARGFDSEICVDGEKAVARITAFRPHLVLLDLTLPGSSGLDVCRRVRSQSLEPRPRIIASTGHSRAQVDAELDEAGFDGYLLKPVKLDQLLAVLPERDD